MQQISPAAVKAWLDDPARPNPVLIDVREAWEVALCSIAGARHVPLATIPARAGEFNRDADLVMVCHHGNRSMQAGLFLERQGCSKVFNLAGGVAAWARTVDPAMATY